MNCYNQLMCELIHISKEMMIENWRLIIHVHKSKKCTIQIMDIRTAYNEPRYSQYDLWKCINVFGVIIQIMGT